MTVINPWFFMILLLGFASGFVLSRVMNRKMLGGLQDEVSNLERRLQGAESLLAQKAGQNWQDLEGLQRSHEPTPGEISNPMDATVLEDTDISFDQDTQPGEMSSNPPDKARQDRDALVCIKKVIGKDSKSMKLYARLTGLEQNPPEVGRRYRIQLEDGSFLNTSVVTKVAVGHIQTQNSVYLIEPAGVTETWSSENSR